MHKPPMKQTIQQLYLTGKSIREISRILELSRNTVRSILRNKDADIPDSYPVKSVEHELVDLIKPLLTSCKGNLVRVHEILAEKYQKNMPYSTLANLVRKYQLRNPPSRRVGEYVFDPGVEMQHDTSPHWVEIDGYLTLTTEQVNIFFKLIDMRYHKKSTIITTNLEYADWYDIFKNKPLVDAMLDRFRHYCTTIHIKGDSLRTPNEIKQSSKSLKETP